jgi:hypothetical protein
MRTDYRISRTIVPAASLALVTVEQAKTTLGIDTADTSQDAALQALIGQVSAAIHRYIDRILVQQGYRDQFRYVANWMFVGEPLQLWQYPVALDEDDIPVAVVVQDGNPVDAALYEADDERGLLYSIDASGAYGWTGLLITVDYTAGYDPIPEDVQAAALDWLTARWHSEGRDPSLRSETVPDLLAQTYAGADPMASTGIPGTARDLLAPYMRPAL